MTSRIARLEPAFVEHFPAVMTPGVLYVSFAYRTCGHVCCCGCGHEVVTPLSPAHWSLTYDGENVTLRPSIGSWSLACQSHYWISNGQIRWSRRYSRADIAENRTLDRAQLLRWTAQEAHGPSPQRRRQPNPPCADT